MITPFGTQRGRSDFCQILPLLSLSINSERPLVVLCLCFWKKNSVIGLMTGGKVTGWWQCQSFYLLFTCTVECFLFSALQSAVFGVLSCHIKMNGTCLSNNSFFENSFLDHTPGVEVGCYILLSLIFKDVTGVACFANCFVSQWEVLYGSSVSCINNMDLCTQRRRVWSCEHS
jgi:hypothetical protein